MHLSVLCSLAIAQPLFEVLRGYPAFFVAHHATRADLWLLVLGLLVVLPLVLAALSRGAGRASRRLGQGLHLFWVAALTSLILLAPFKRVVLGSEELRVVSALLLGTAGAVAYWRSAPLRSCLTVLAFLPPLVAGLFLAHPAIAKIGAGFEMAGGRAPRVGSDASVVLVVLDELPLTSLLAPDGTIDELLFPNFARLARSSTWFRNATASHAKTTFALPGILTGHVPTDPDQLPLAVDHPRSLFTLLAGSHRMKVHESSTSVCPAELLETPSGEPTGARLRSMLDDLSLVYAHIVLPERLTLDLPTVSEGLRDFGVGAEAEVADGGQDRDAHLQAFIADIDGRSEPTLYFFHDLLPHPPWIFSPSGTRYADPGQIPGLTERGRWGEDASPTELALQRHLLQVGHIDRRLGQLLDRLEETGVHDRALIVLVADHGASFEPGRMRRTATPDNVRDIMHVPLLVKLPGQRAGRVSDRNVEAIDLLPTVIDVLDVDVDWSLEGSSVYAEGEARTVKRIHNHLTGPVEVQDVALPSEWPALERKTRLLGAGAGWDDVWTLGRRPDLIGGALASRATGVAGVVRADVDQASRFAAVDPAAGELPALVTGSITAGAGARLPTELALALNGVVRAVAPTYERTAGEAKFAAMIDEHAFRPGANLLELFAIEGDGWTPIPLREYRLVLEDGRPVEVVSSDGAHFEFGRGTLAGVLELAEEDEGRLVLAGWAADVGASDTVDTVLVFHGDALLFAGRTEEPRPGLEGLLDQAVAFRYELPLVALPAGGLRVVALRQGAACELRCGARARWVCGPEGSR